MTPTLIDVGPGRRVAVHRAGDREPLVVCVPGGPARAAAYLENLGGLDAHVSLALVDMRGTGSSDPVDDPSEFTPEQFADDLDAVRAALGLDRMVLLAHSYGSRVFAHYVQKYAAHVSAGVLVTPSPLLPPERFAERVVAIDTILDRRTDVPEAVEARRAIEHTPRSERGQLENLMRPLWYARWDVRAQAHAASAKEQTNIRGEYSLRKVVAHEDNAAMRAALAALDVPVLVVMGELDAMTPRTDGEDLGELLPRAQLAVLAQSGHFPWVDDPAQFVSVVADFLGRV